MKELLNVANVIIRPAMEFWLVFFVVGVIMNNYVIEPHNYERFINCFKEVFAEQLLKEGNETALAALLELITEWCLKMFGQNMMGVMNVFNVV